MSYSSNEGACALLDIVNMSSTDPKDLAAARQAWTSLSIEARAAVLSRHAVMFGSFDPTTGECVCLCCGKPNWTHRMGLH